MAADASLADLDILPPLRAETGAKSIDAMGCGGGYVLNSVHNLQADVPAANVVAMFDQARTCDGPH